ncbi:hypothetical protein NDU88_000278 [Pleurodeles waltl]|uniref:Uncharacterized protein n=2 Tax=Pleurodeles waltl TaxID=8319 RepID=A0AAV7SVY8_PLEWA|nr:hypothetical protein NDU88_000278 [Pleurodeles waltl]
MRPRRGWPGQRRRRLTARQVTLVRGALSVSRTDGCSREGRPLLARRGWSLSPVGWFERGGPSRGHVRSAVSRAWIRVVVSVARVVLGAVPQVFGALPPRVSMAPKGRKRAAAEPAAAVSARVNGVQGAEKKSKGPGGAGALRVIIEHCKS